MGKSRDRCYVINGMKGKWLVFSAAAIVMAIVGGTFWLHHPNPQPLSSAASAVAEELTPAITLSDTIRRAHVVGGSAPVPGYIDVFHIDVFLANVGEEVYAGRELARIGTGGLESDRAQAQARLDATQRAVASAQLEAWRADDDAPRARRAGPRTEDLRPSKSISFEAGATPRLTYESASRELENAVLQWAAVDKAAR